MTAQTAIPLSNTAPDFRVGLIGKGIQQSRTPLMHMNEGTAQGFVLQYDLLDTDKMEPVPALSELLDRVEAEGYVGLNITFPYKQEVMQYLDELSEAARQVGAVNTVVFRDGKRFGHNTDFWGYQTGLEWGLPEAKKGCVLLMGAGGAGGAVAHALAGSGVQHLLITDVRPETAQALAEAVANAHGIKAEAVTDMALVAAQADGLVNATPMGMAKLPGMAIAAELIEERHWVSDIVYFPLETELLRVARSKGCKTSSGQGMATFQAVRAFELFTGRKPEPERMRVTFESFDKPQA